MVATLPSRTRLHALIVLVVVVSIGPIAEASSAKPSIQTTNKPTKSSVAAAARSSPLKTSSSLSSSSSSSSSLLSKAWFHTRRLLNLSNTFGSPTLSVTPYDRIASHPVFSITTPWGSPYMNMEKRNDLSATSSMNDNAQPPTSKRVTSAYEEQNEFRTVVLYFLDPDDALAVHGEMKQMDSMGKSDVRITATSLAKALRQAANLGHGVPTGGIGIDPLDGTLAVDDGGALRYKLVPPKRQLYYAARCVGKERVGLFGDVPAEDAQLCVIGNSALEGTNLMRRREQRERKFPKQPKNAIQAASMHMEGYTGIPVFYCPQLHQQVPTIKRLCHFMASPRQQVPLFFNYEDLEDAWKTMRQRQPSPASIPETPTLVEVFNLWDVLTSMEREAWQKKHRFQQLAIWKRNPKETLQSIPSAIQSTLSSSFSSKSKSKSYGPDLNAITFVPSSRSIQYKEAISARGNGKARLRPMR